MFNNCLPICLGAKNSCFQVFCNTEWRVGTCKYRIDSLDSFPVAELSWDGEHLVEEAEQGVDSSYLA